MNRKLGAVVGGIVVLTTGYLGYRGIRTRPGTQEIFVSGTVEAREADLGFQLAGRLEQLGPREGDRLAPGVEIAALDRSALQAERANAQAQIASAKALLGEMEAGARVEEIGRARAELAVAVDRRDAARRDVDRLRSLADKALISKQAFDHQQTEVDVAAGEVARATEELKLLQAGTRPQRIAAQRAAVAQAEASLERIDAMLAQSTIRAPFTGVVTIRHREPGEAVAAGSPVLTLQNLSDRWVRVYVPGSDVGRIAFGQCATIAADGYADRRYGGIVAYISSVAEFTPRNVQSTKDRVRLVYEVRVRVNGDERLDLKPGLPADVTFPSAAKADCPLATVAAN